MMMLILALNSTKESKKNSSKLVDEKSNKNTSKIMKKKNNPYNLDTRFTHKYQLYWDNQIFTRCENWHNILPLFGVLEGSLTFSALISYTMKHTYASKSNSG
jgi:hypothetical protein